MSGRKLNADELKLHQAALATNDKVRPQSPSSNRQLFTTELDIIHQGCGETHSSWKCPHCCDQLFARGGASFSTARVSWRDDKFAGHVQSHDELRRSHCFPCRDEERDGCVRSQRAFCLRLDIERISFRRKKDMSGEETMVLSHIQASGNEGILAPTHTYTGTHIPDRNLDQAPQS